MESINLNYVAINPNVKAHAMLHWHKSWTAIHSTGRSETKQRQSTMALEPELNHGMSTLLRGLNKALVLVNLIWSLVVTFWMYLIFGDNYCLVLMVSHSSPLPTLHSLAFLLLHMHIPLSFPPSLFLIIPLLSLLSVFVFYLLILLKY